MAKRSEDLYDLYELLPRSARSPFDHLVRQPLTEEELAVAAKELGSIHRDLEAVERRLADAKEIAKTDREPLEKRAADLYREVNFGREVEAQVVELMDFRDNRIITVRPDTMERVREDRAMTEEERKQPPLPMRR